MTARRAFIDSNVLLYLLSADTAKADRAEAIVQAGARISVQVLNEITNVARRKLAMPWPDVNEVVRLIQSLCPVEPLTVETHDKGRQIAERYGFSLCDAMIIAAALRSDCEILYSEDMQDGILIEEGLRIRNPFAAGLPLGAA
ncbi:PIN domain-containing protein [Cupriavidus basilensis]|uniref:PIN domain-containing protein n=1 Tax=Cupriavidus basilensis TaxID=68895 RepID=UPI0039F6AA1C